MNEQEIKALLSLLNVCKQNEHTGNVQINYFKGTAGTVQVLTSYKLDALVNKYGESVVK